VRGSTGDSRRPTPAEPGTEEAAGRIATFVSGLSLGALAGAMLVGSVLLRRSGRRTGPPDRVDTR
jgi:hypothetical protein